MSEMKASEALFGFAAWLTCRDEITTLSAKHSAAPAADLVQQFCDTNNLSEPEDGWEKNLTHPD